MLTRKFGVVLTVVIGLIMVACSPTGPAQNALPATPTSPAQDAPTAAPTNPPQDAPTAAPSPSLNNTGWLLENLNGQTLLPDMPVILSFTKEGFYGSDGCNLYNGSYTLDGEKITVNDNIAVTLMACEEQVMKQGSAYITALSQAKGYKITNQQLTLLDSQGKTLATFTQSAELAAKDPQNATYLIDGKAVTLVNGVAEVEAAPGSAAKQVTRIFGNAVDVDLNGDGVMDSALLLTQEGGGSGSFTFVAGALHMPDGYLGTNAILIGDRVAPQNINIDPSNPAQFIVNYADRKPGEPMSTQPSQAVSKWFKLENDMLVDVTPATAKP